MPLILSFAPATARPPPPISSFPPLCLGYHFHFIRPRPTNWLQGRQIPVQVALASVHPQARWGRRLGPPYVSALHRDPPKKVCMVLTCKPYLDAILYPNARPIPVPIFIPIVLGLAFWNFQPLLLCLPAESPSAVLSDTSLLIFGWLQPLPAALCPHTRGLPPLFTVHSHIISLLPSLHSPSRSGPMTVFPRPSTCTFLLELPREARLEPKPCRTHGSGHPLSSMAPTTRRVVIPVGNQS